MLHRPHLTRREAHRIIFIAVLLAGGIEVICCYGFISQRQVLEVLTIVAVWTKDHARKVIKAFIEIEEETKP